MPDPVDRIIAAARHAKEAMIAAGMHVPAQAVQSLIVSRQSARGLNRGLTRDFRALRALLVRAADTMARRDADGLSTEVAWNALLADMQAALATPFPGLLETSDG